MLLTLALSVLKDSSLRERSQGEDDDGTEEAHCVRVSGE